MTNKMKVSDIARDFSMESKEIIAILSKHTGEAKKSGAALNEQEINILFEVLTLKHKVKSFDDYFATGADAAKAAAEKRKADKDQKLAEQMAILEQLKAAQQAAQAEAKPA